MKASVGVLLKDKKAFESPLLISYSKTESVNGKEETKRVLRQQVPDLLIKPTDFIPKGKRKIYLKQKGLLYIDDKNKDERIAEIINDTKAYLEECYNRRNGNYPTAKQLKDEFFKNYFHKEKIKHSDLVSDMESELFIDHRQLIVNHQLLTWV